MIEMTEPEQDLKPEIEDEEPKIKRATITSLNKELQEYKDYVEEMLANHAEAFKNLKQALEVHCWEPDAHHPAFLAKKMVDRAKQESK